MTWLLRHYRPVPALGAGHGENHAPSSMLCYNFIDKQWTDAEIAAFLKRSVPRSITLFCRGLTRLDEQQQNRRSQESDLLQANGGARQHLNRLHNNI